ncbi:MAG: chorismate synthase, partial [Candidatus Riflebacteria bacterium]|nr:chorismate synthase [Candidatus Riflebacteria bacterium]
PLLLRFHMKPLPGNAAVSSVNLDTMEKAMPAFYRSDIQAVTAAAIVAESVIALQLASEIIDFTGGSSMQNILLRLQR